MEFLKFFFGSRAVRHKGSGVPSGRLIEVRAGLTESPFSWDWSSAGQKNGLSIPINEWPLAKPEKWEEFLRRGGNPVEEAKVREALTRGLPLYKPSNL